LVIVLLVTVAAKCFDSLHALPHNRYTQARRDAVGSSHLISSRANNTRRHQLLDLGPHAGVLEVVVQGRWVRLRLVEDALHDRVW
jgi:hypothetical protein